MRFSSVIRSRRPGGELRSAFLACLLAALAALSTSAEMILDPTFNPGTGANFFAEDVLPLRSGKILVCGQFNTFNGAQSPFLARLNEDGSVDPSFHTDVFVEWVRHLAEQPDGKLIVSGAFTMVAGKPQGMIARLDEDGSVDPTFNPGAGFSEKIVPEDPNPALIFWHALQPDGKIVVTGSFAKFNGQNISGIARLNSDGSLDSTFNVGTGFDSWGRFVTVLPNGQILVTGWFTSYNGSAYNRMVRLNPDGSPDPSFRPFFGDKTSIYSAALLPDGKFIASGHTKNEEGAFSRHIIRLNPDGSEDVSFLGHSDNRTESILVQPDGKFVICGFFTMVDDKPRASMARLNADGSLDETFRADTDSWVWTTALDGKNRLLMAGLFQTINGAMMPKVARLVESASVPPPTAPTANSQSVSTRQDASVAITLSGSGPAGTPLQFVVGSPPSKGTLNGVPPNLTYTPRPNASGADSFTFTVAAGAVQSQPATVSIDISAQEHVPEAGNLNLSTTLSQPIPVILTAHDSDGDPLSYQVTVPPTHGSVSGAAPNLTYTPDSGFSGSDSFQYSVSDGTQSASGVVSIIVVAQSHPPSATDSSLLVVQGEPASLTLYGSDLDGDTLAYRIVNAPRKGTLSGTPPHLVYTSSPNESGEDFLTYTVSDGNMESAQATINISILPRVRTPTASSFTINAEPGQAVPLLLAGSDPDGKALTFIIVLQPGKGALSGTPPSLVYTASAGARGEDVLSYITWNGSLQSAPAQVTIEIGTANHPPAANDLNLAGLVGESIPVQLSGSDQDGGILAYRIISQPPNGLISGTSPAFTYTPVANWSGVDSFQYVANDGIADSPAATVTIQINPRNQPPSASSFNFSAVAGEPLELSLAGSDAEGGALTFRIISGPSNGTLAGVAPALIYTPFENASGTDTIVYVTNDGTSDSAAGTITIEVSAKPRPQKLAISQVGEEGSFALQVAGPAGRSYVIQCSTDGEHWVRLGEGSTSLGGTADFVDHAPSDRCRLYRVLWP